MNVGSFEVGHGEVGGAPLTSSQALSGVARITPAGAATTTRTITGVAKITATTAQTLSGRGRITGATTRTLTGVAHITGTTTQALSGLAKIQGTAAGSLTGVARITLRTPRTLQGVANIVRAGSEALTGVANIVFPGLRQITGVAHILVSASSGTLSGRARITAASARTLSATAHILVSESSTHLLSGLARITGATQRTLTGVASIRQSSARTLAGRAHILVPASATRTLTGVARIAGPGCTSLPFPIATAVVQVDPANQPSPAYYMGVAAAVLRSTARNQQAYGPWAVGSAWYQLLVNNTSLTAEVYVSLDQGATWSAVDAAHAPAFTNGYPCFAPVQQGANIWAAYLGAGGLVVRKFDTALGAHGQWSTLSAALPASVGNTADYFTWDLIVKADGQYVMIYSRNPGTGSYITEVRTYAAGAWSAATNLDSTFTSPVMTGFSFDPAGQLGYVFYTQGLSFASAWPSPNPLKVVTVDVNGSIGTPQTVAANLTNAFESSGQIFTYPAIDAMAVFKNGNALVSFTHRDPASLEFFPAYFLRSGGAWTGPFWVSTDEADQVSAGIPINTMLAQIPGTAGPITYLVWAATNENAASGDGSINQVKCVTTADGVSFSAPRLVWDAIANPPPHFTDRVGGGSFLNLNVNFVNRAGGGLAMPFSIGYTDSVTQNYVVAFGSTFCSPPRNNYIALGNTLMAVLRFIV